MLKDIDFDWQNVLGKVWSVLQVFFWGIVFVILMGLIIGFLLFVGAIITDSLGLTQNGFATPNRRTYQQKQMDEYAKFEKECLSREYSKDQCLIIWSKDDD